MSQRKWTAEREADRSGQVVRVRLCEARVSLTAREVLQGLFESPEFRAFFGEAIASASFLAFRWEVPPLKLATVDRCFECVLVNAPGLGQRADPGAFASKLAALGSGELVSAFPNLGGDAFLVVPALVGPISAYPHLAAFLRLAPEGQQHALWREVASRALAMLEAEPFWLSTAGAGVPWLHVRLDKAPKYYSYQPYRRVEG